MSRGLVDQNNKLLTATQIIEAFNNDEIVGVRIKLKLQHLDDVPKHLPMFAKLVDMQGAVATDFIITSTMAPYDTYKLTHGDFHRYYELD